MQVPYDETLVELFISVSFLQSMDQIVLAFKEAQKKFREKSSLYKFNDTKNIMLYQFTLGMLIAQVNQLAAPKLAALVKEYNLDETQFMQQAMI